MDVVPEYFNVFPTTLLVFTLCFSAYWFLYSSEGLKRRWNSENRADYIELTKYAGFVLLGIAPLLSIWLAVGDLNEVIKLTGLTFHIENPRIWIWVVLSFIPILMVSWFSAGKSEFQQKYPEKRINDWGARSILLHAAAWFFYLIAYEFLFRGLLFLLPSMVWGWKMALAMNLAFYVLTHIPKGVDEALGAIPVGIFLCWVTGEAQSIVPAIIVHLLMAWSGNCFAIIRNPHMKISPAM